MKKNKLVELSMDLAVEIIELVKQLKSKRESIVSRQIGRSGTSIGANIREAQYAHGKPDFIAKLQIALKEANETGYWLELLLKTDYINKEYYEKLDKLCSNIRVLLITSINTTKRNIENSKNNTKEQLRKLFKEFKQYVKGRNLPECKMLINNYVEEVIIYKDHIEVIFNVASLILKGYDKLRIVTSISKWDLIRYYSEGYWYKKSNF